MDREDYRDRIKNKLAELTVNLPGIFPDSEINSAFLDTIRGLPYKGVYNETKWYKTLSVNVSEYALESEHYKVEKVEVNEGTADLPRWTEVKGYEVFANTLHLATLPSLANTIRVWVKTKFTEITDDSTTVDVPDDKSEAVIYGSVRRLLENLIHYIIDSKNYDSILKPDGLSLPQIKAWRDEIRAEEERIVKSFQTKPRPRDMDLVN